MGTLGCGLTAQGRSPLSMFLNLGVEIGFGGHLGQGREMTGKMAVFSASILQFCVLPSLGE